jgi:hypothetical protein
MITTDKKPRHKKYPATLAQWAKWKITGKSPYGPYYLAGIRFSDF